MESVRKKRPTSKPSCNGLSLEVENELAMRDNKTVWRMSLQSIPCQTTLGILSRRLNTTQPQLQCPLHHHHHSSCSLAAKTRSWTVTGACPRPANHRISITHSHCRFSVTNSSLSCPTWHCWEINHTPTIQRSHQSILDTLVPSRYRQYCWFRYSCVTFDAPIDILLFCNYSSFSIHGLVASSMSHMDDEKGHNQTDDDDGHCNPNAQSSFGSGCQFTF